MISVHRLLPAPPHEPATLDEVPTRPSPLDAAVVPAPTTEPLPLEALVGASGVCQTAARRFLMLCIEVCQGFRPSGQLVRVCRPAEAVQITEEISRLARRVGEHRPRTAGRGEAVKPRRLRVCEPRPGIGEAAVVLNAYGTVIAFAFRIERQADGAWLATAAVLL
jgi:hypothetical protein